MYKLTINCFKAYLAFIMLMLIFQRTAVILNGPNDWDEWFEIVKTKTIEGEIWEFLDPKVVKDRLFLLIEFTVSILVDVDPEKTIFI